MRRLLLVGALIGTLACASSAGAAGVLFIRGGGYGHGIGMSQYGAYGYALHAKDYRFILAHYYRGTTLGHVDPDQTVRVRLSTGSAAFAGATGAGTTGAGTTHLRAELTYRVLPQADGALVLMGPNGKKLGRFAAPLLVTGPGLLQVAGLGSYRGALEFGPDGSGGVQTVDAVGLDDYVRGVIAAEMPAGWPAAALQTQAVAARTYALTTSVAGTGFTLYPDTRSQVYRGASAETPATDAAVAATRGQVVQYAGVPATTYFFASSGGYTENIENVWSGAPPEPWLRGVPDPFDGAGGDPYHHWGHAYSLRTAASKLRGILRGSLIGVRVLRQGVSARILTAEVVGSRGSTAVTGDQLQQRLGLASTLAAFTTITTAPGSGQRALAAARPGALGLFALQRALAVARAPALHGAVFPARSGARYSVQRFISGAFKTVMKLRLGAGGTFGIRVNAPGRYRIVYGGLDGPPVTVS